MIPITRCEHCGEKLIPKFGENGRTELTCRWCDQLEALPVPAEQPKMPEGRLAKTPPKAA